ncbi:MAG: hypothetical protein H0X50_08225 [Nitrosopumilus sp.]|nr:hypothetical protein [Nitrosopumilus sp.]
MWQYVLQQARSEQVNIVGHSKGGLDARVYLYRGTNDVAHLIMIGTPNNGSPQAELYIDAECLPASADLRPRSIATSVNGNPLQTIILSAETSSINS